ncbi:MAG: biotin transporter BioY [Armatimonadetes bacterium]|nr:biotin transporter BioY [Armatimonadota bacterium]
MQALTQIVTNRLALPTTRRAALVATGTVGFTLAMITAAHVRVPLPFSPVPVTMQTLVALLAGATLGPGAGASSMLLYLGLGAAGLPVFATGAAVGVTGGYLIGFAVAAALVGQAARAKRADMPVLAAMIGGSVIIYALGATWMALVLNMSAGRAIAVGVLPFIPGDALKVVAAFGLWRMGRAGRARPAA